jgi:hypothetical protein
VCGSTIDVVVHHLADDARSPGRLIVADSQLQTLCRKHHGEAHRDLRQQAKRGR